jgi:putative restriction endonuclease
MSYGDVTLRSVLAALAEFDRLGEDRFLNKYGFGPARSYFLAHQDRRYPSKAIVGAAHGFAFPEQGPLRSEDFSGGEATVGRVLERLGFQVLVRQPESAARYQEVLNLADVASESMRREEMWRALFHSRGPRNVEPSLLRELCIYGGAQGVWVDKERTKSVAPSGVTVGLLHTGSSYADDLTDDAVLYHYPNTNRSSGRDKAEILATKTAGRLELPVFVISYPSPGSSRRDVHRGWVTDWDDDSGEFLVIFGDEPVPRHVSESDDDAPFSLTAKGGRKARSSMSYDRDPQFKFDVFKRYGPRCAVCDIAVKEVLQAAHIRGKKDKGSDDPRNGLVLCATHHAAYDAELFAVEPSSLKVHVLARGPTLGELGITVTNLSRLRRSPHSDALEWRWKAWEG